MSAYTYREGEGLRGAPCGPSWGQGGHWRWGTPWHGWVLCARLCAGSLGGSRGSPLGLRVPQLGAAPSSLGLLGTLRSPQCHFKGDLQVWQRAAPGLCRPTPGTLGLPPGRCLAPSRGAPGCAPARRGPVGSPSPLSPPSLPSCSPPGTPKVLKVKYYRLLCCCLTTTDKLRTSCQNVSAQQINIQNESQRYVVYN